MIWLLQTVVAEKKDVVADVATLQDPVFSEEVPAAVYSGSLF